MYRIDMFVIDVLRHDIEDIEAILRMLNSRSALGWRNFWPRDFCRQEVLDALGRLLSTGLVSPLRYDHTRRELVDIDGPVEAVDASELWFKLEPSAIQQWEQWDSPKGRSDENFE